MKSHATAAQPLEHLPCNHEVVGFEPDHWTRFFSYICAHFGILRRCRIILSRFRLRGQLQYRTALRSAVKIRSIFEIQVQENSNYILYFLMETYKSLEINLKTMIWDNWHKKLALKLLIVPSFKMWWKMTEFETLDSYAYLCYEAFEVLVCFLCWEFW